MFKKARLLLVDDDEALRASLRDQPELNEIFSIDEAGNGSDAINLISKNKYELVLLDIGLPDMDGRNVCKSMRAAGVDVLAEFSNNFTRFSFNASPNPE